MCLRFFSPQWRNRVSWPKAAEATYGTQKHTPDKDPCFSAIHARDTSKQAAVGLYIRPHGHRDRQVWDLPLPRFVGQLSLSPQNCNLTVSAIAHRIHNYSNIFLAPLTKLKQKFYMVCFPCQMLVSMYSTAP